MLAEQDKIKKMTGNLPNNLRESVANKLLSKAQFPTPKLVDPLHKPKAKKEPEVQQPRFEDSISVNAMKQVSQMMGAPSLVGAIPPQIAAPGMMPFMVPQLGNQFPVNMPLPGFNPAFPGDINGLPGNMAVPPPNMGMPPPMIDATEQLFRARADLYRRDLSRINDIPSLMEYSKI